MHIAYVDELERNCNVVGYLLVRQDLFDITVDSKTLKTKGGKAPV